MLNINAKYCFTSYSPKCVAQISYRALFTTILYLCGKRQIISKLPKLIPKYDFFFSSNLSTKGIL